MVERILVATDGSSRSLDAVRGAVELAVQHHLELIAVTVVPREAMNYSDGLFACALEDIERVETAVRSKARSVLFDVVKSAGYDPERSDVEAIVSDQFAAATIAVAERCRSDLIIMAPRRRNRLAQFLLGNDARNIQMRVQIPVFVMP